MHGVDQFKIAITNIERVFAARRVLAGSGGGAYALPWIVPRLQRRGKVPLLCCWSPPHTSGGSTLEGFAFRTQTKQCGVRCSVCLKNGIAALRPNTMLGA